MPKHAYNSLHRIKPWTHTHRHIHAFKHDIIFRNWQLAFWRMYLQKHHQHWLEARKIQSHPLSTTRSIHYKATTCEKRWQSISTEVMIAVLGNQALKESRSRKITSCDPACTTIENDKYIVAKYGNISGESRCQLQTKASSCLRHTHVSRGPPFRSEVLVERDGTPA